jgi:uncharacterized protein
MLQLPSLGVGIVWWPPLDPLCHESEELISVIEAEPEAYWIPHVSVNGVRGFRSYLCEALNGLSQPKLLHGVGAPVGGTCPPPLGHAEAFARDIESIHPPWISEHLSFSHFQPAVANKTSAPEFAGFLLPPFQSHQAIHKAAENIRRRRISLGEASIAFETGVSYLPPRSNEVPDGEFASAVAEEADCGILLDLHNLYCNQRNGRQSVAGFCASLPLERVWELHLAGGEDYRGFRLDAHSGLIEPALMEMAIELVPSLPSLRAIIFELMPAFASRVGLSAIRRQLERLNDLWELRNKSVNGVWRQTPHHIGASARTADYSATGSWETLLGTNITGFAEQPPPESIAEWWRAAGPALDLYRHLAGEGRASMLVTTAPRTIRLLLRHLGSTASRQLLAKFWHASRAAYTAVDEGQAFLRFLSESELTVPGIIESVADDEAALTQLMAGDI